jgi:SAM-dependent methyltransferase
VLDVIRSDIARYYQRALRKAGRALLAAANANGRPPAGESPPDAPAGRRRRRTVVEGWEAYARARRGKRKVGDVWSNPKVIGLDVEKPEDVVPYLDRTVFEPFLQTCEVLLEIGPGGGRFTEVLLPKCKKLIAVDSSPTMLDLLRERFPDEERLECRLGNGRGLGGVADDSVDAVFSYGVFVHLQHWDIYNYLTEVRRVLKPGGKALIQHSNLLSDLGWAHFEREVPRQLNRHKLPSTFIPNTPDLMREFVTRAGLECLEMKTDVARRDCIALMRKPGGATGSALA